MFHTPQLTFGTFLLMRLEYLLLESGCILLFLLHFQEIHWLLFVGLFVYIDLVGYLPGKIAHVRMLKDMKNRSSNAHTIPSKYYYAYNLTHSFLFNAMVLGVISAISGPDWAMLAVPIHLLGDRSIFGNIFKSPVFPFEPLPSSPLPPPPCPILKPILPAPTRLAPIPQHDGMQRCSPAILSAYSNFSSAFLTMNHSTRHFTSPILDGFIAYRRFGGHIFMLGPIFAPTEHKAALFQEFRQWVEKNAARLAIVQIPLEEAFFFQAQGFKVNQFGTSYALRLGAFSLAGTRFMKLRNKLKRVQREGVMVDEVGRDVPFQLEDERQIGALTDAWLSTKGRHVKLLQFLVGDLLLPPTADRRLFVARREGHIIGFISYVPVFGEQKGWMHDLSRRLPDAPPGVMEFINVTAIEQFRKEGVMYLHFGLTPFVGVDDRYDAFEKRNHLISWAIRKLVDYGEAIYPAKSQAAYKEKWYPDVVVPEYFAFESRVPLLGVIRLLRLTQAI